MLEIIVSLLYFTNKIFLSIEKRTGWIIGALASATAMLYFISIKVYLLLILEAGFFALMLYGLKNHKASQKNNIFIYAIMILTMLGMLFTMDEVHILEFIVSIGFILAIHSLAVHRWKLGWIIMGISHAFMAVFAYQKEQHFFMTMQLISIIVAIYALLKKRTSIPMTT
ncbi:nicotinamide mononucleotide transporter [Aquimarina rhabdastrellae]